MLWQMISHHKGMMTAVAVLRILNNGLETASNLVLIYAINAITAKKLSLFAILISTMILGYVVVCLTGYGSKVLEEKLIQKENHRIRKAYVHNQMQLAVSQDLRTDQAINFVTNDILLYDQQYLAGFFKLFNCIFGMVFASIALIMLHWSLFALSIVMTVCLLMIPKLVGKRLGKTTKNISKSNDALLHTLNDWFKGYHDLLWNKALLQLWQRTRLAFDRLENAYVDQTRAQQVATQLDSLINIASQAAIIALAGFLAIQGQVSLGVVMSAGNLAFQLFGAVSLATSSIILLQSGKSLRDKIAQFTKAPAADKAVSNHALTDIKVISAHDLTYNYDQGSQIHYPDFTVKQGDKVLITGPSGSGKTTLINLLNGRLKDYQGTLKLNGQDYKTFSKLDFLKIFGLQPQHYHIFNDTISNNITLHDKNLSQDQVARAIHKAQLTDKIASLPAGFDTQIGPSSDVLSGGEMQRISLARFFIRKQPALIVDEGTSALDKKNAEQIMQLLTKDSKLTLFVITHSIDEDVLKLFNKHIQLD